MNSQVFFFYVILKALFLYAKFICLPLSNQKVMEQNTTKALHDHLLAQALSRFIFNST